MPADRIWRFSSCGLMFLGGMLYFFLLLGGHLNLNQENFKISEGFNIFLSLFITTPVIGVVISTITVKFLFLLRGYKQYCYVPKDRRLIKNVVKRFKRDLRNFDPDPDKLKGPRLKQFYPYYQSEIRRLISEEPLQFLDRRWSTANTQTNNVSALLLAFVFMVYIRWDNFSLCDILCGSERYLVIIFFVLLLYIFFAVWHIYQSRWEGQQFEHIYLADSYREEKKKSKRDKAGQSIRLTQGAQ